MDKDELFTLLRTALMQLDDIESLNHSPLLSALSESGNPTTPFLLQQLLLEEIEALMSATDVPPGYWEVLYFRFANQLNQDKVAYQLGIGVRQLRRLQNNAIRFLAERLWARFQLDGDTPEPLSESPAIQQEVTWLRAKYSTETSRVATELNKALRDAAPLAHLYDVTLQCRQVDEECLALIPPQILRQALLTLLTGMIVRLGPNLDITLMRSGADVHCRIEPVEQGRAERVLLGCQVVLSAVKQLLAPFAGTIQLQAEEPRSVILTLPRQETIPILVLDDNPDTWLLFRRYATHSRYRLITTDDARAAISLAQQHEVRALILDIMMFDVAGWDLLSEWCHQPATRDIPVAVCTVLPQQDLAYLLGAKAFMQKPVSQAILLKTLDSLTGVQTRISG